MFTREWSYTDRRKSPTNNKNDQTGVGNNPLFRLKHTAIRHTGATTFVKPAFITVKT